MKSTYVYLVICACVVLVLGGCGSRSDGNVTVSSPDKPESRAEIFVPASVPEDHGESVSKPAESAKADTDTNSGLTSEAESASKKAESASNNSSGDVSSTIYYASKVILPEASESAAGTSSDQTSQQTPNETTVTYEYYEEEPQPPAEAEKALEISMSSTSVAIGQTAELSVTYGGEELSESECKVYSWDDSVAKIEGGSVYAVSEGICTVSTEYDGKTANVTITVFDGEKPDPDLNFYVDGILIVNKKYYIDAQSDPGGLSDECVAAFDRLVSGAAADGIGIYALSDYRSYAEQEEIYNSYVAMYGYDGANALCALPGHSEHQTGLAIDCATPDTGYFPGSAAAIWLDAHCAEYGFIIRYPYGKDAYTGYSYEPWHIRYVGSAAQDIQSSGLSLEEYFGLT